MPEIFTLENAIALLTLTSLEIILGIDNIVFIAILSSKLPKEIQPKARKIGLFFAMITRILLLLSLSWVMRLKTPLFHVHSHEISGRDLILLLGGLFLIGKSTFEIHEKVEGKIETHSTPKSSISLKSVIFQIMILDIIFSLDSVITAVGMAKSIWVMILAVMVAVGVMILFAEGISHFIEKHPTFKMLALAFLLLIGVMLVAEGLGRHIEKGYIYFAMFFSLMVEILNIRMRNRSQRTPEKPLV